MHQLMEESKSDLRLSFFTLPDSRAKSDVGVGMFLAITIIHRGDIRKSTNTSFLRSAATIACANALLAAHQGPSLVG